MRRPLVAGNWKMNGTVTSVDALVTGLVSADSPSCELLVCPPSVFLAQVRAGLSLAGHEEEIGLGAQDVSQHESGAFTGENSADMLVEFGCRYVLIGHSERRQYHGESDEAVAAKVERCLAVGLRPIVCIGETLEQRRNGSMLTIIARQLGALAQTVAREDWGRFDIAYEPVWAIGTGESATPEQAQEVHAMVRSTITDHGDPEDFTRILYGGSVNDDNAKALFEMADIDGALVGGASLNVQSFMSIAESAG